MEKQLEEAYKLLKRYGKTPATLLEEKFGKGVTEKLREVGLATVVIERDIIYVIPGVNEKVAYRLLKKILDHVDGYMPLCVLRKKEVRLLPKLKKYGFINYDNDAVWITMDGYVYVCDLEKLNSKQKT